MRRPGPDEWKQILADQPSSGLSQKEFCAKHDLSLSTFQYWLYRRSKLESKIGANPSVKFLPLDVIASAASSTRPTGQDAIELGLRSGTVVRVPVGTDVRYLAELLAALG